MIRALISGKLHDAPQVRTSQNGNSFTTAKLRADDGKGGSVWCSLIGFGEAGERLATLKPGSALSVSGRCEVSAWLNKEGEAKAGLSVVVDELVTLKSKPKPPQQRPQQPRQPVAAEFDDMDDWTP